MICVTAQTDTADDIQRIAAAVGASVRTVPDVLSAVPWWNTADLVLLDTRVLSQVKALSLPRRPRVVTVSRSSRVGADPGVWREAMDIGAQTLVALPEGEPWLLEAIARAAHRDAVRAPIVCVVGARGGAGASTFAAALAQTAVGEDLHCYLVDLDPSGSGLQVTLGADRIPGVGWHDLDSAVGRVPAELLRRELPNLGGIRLVTWTGPEVSLPAPGVAASVLDAARRDADVVVVDLARWLLLAEESRGAIAMEVLTRSDQALVVCPADVRSATAASRVLLSPLLAGVEIGVVVRGPAPGALTGADIAQALGLPLVATMAAHPRIDQLMEEGLPPLRSRRGPLNRACRKVLHELARVAVS